MRVGIGTGLLAAALAVLPVAGAAKGRWETTRVRDPSAPEAPALAVRLYLPDGYDGRRPLPLLLALAGYDHDGRVWETESVLPALADREGFVVACPSLGRSVYESAYYPETQVRWGPRPGGEWVAKVLLPHLHRHFAVARDRARTAVLGYSTGAHGALLLCETHPVFGACAGLSGTYDFRSLPPGGGERRIHERVYGPASRFPARWDRDDCAGNRPVRRLRGVRVFLAHGRRDAVVGADQTATLSARLDAAGVAHDVILDPDGAHDWAFWNTQLPAAVEAWAAAWKDR